MMKKIKTNKINILLLMLCIGISSCERDKIEEDDRAVASIASSNVRSVNHIAKLTLTRRPGEVLSISNVSRRDISDAEWTLKGGGAGKLLGPDLAVLMFEDKTPFVLPGDKFIGDALHVVYEEEGNYDIELILRFNDPVSILVSDNPEGTRGEIERIDPVLVDGIWELRIPIFVVVRNEDAPEEDS